MKINVLKNRVKKNLKKRKKRKALPQMLLALDALIKAFTKQKFKIQEK